MDEVNMDSVNIDTVPMYTEEGTNSAPVSTEHVTNQYLSDISSSSESSCSSPHYKYNRRRRNRHHRSRHHKHKQDESTTLKSLVERVNILSNILVKPAPENVAQSSLQNTHSQELFVEQAGVPGYQYISVQADVHEPPGAGDAFNQFVIEAPNVCQEASLPAASYKEVTSQVLRSVDEPCTSAQNAKLFCSDPVILCKDPAIKPAIPAELETISNLQKFGCPDWMRIPFFETQKTHLFTPGFCALKTNTEIGPFDTSTTFPFDFENTLAAITHAAIVQRSAVQERLQKVVDWCYSGINLTPELVTEKIKELFVDDKQFGKVNDDILQIACGKRASIIHHRRNNVLNQCSNSIVMSKLREIPPSVTHLFENSQLEKVLIDHGGATNNFTKPITKPVSGVRNYRSAKHHHHHNTSHKTRQGQHFQERPSQPFQGRAADQRGEEVPAGYNSRKRPQEFTVRNSAGDAKRKRYR